MRNKARGNYIVTQGFIFEGTEAEAVINLIALVLRIEEGI